MQTSQRETLFDKKQIEKKTILPIKLVNNDKDEMIYAKTFELNYSFKFGIELALFLRNFRICCIKLAFLMLMLRINFCLHYLSLSREHQDWRAFVHSGQASGVCGGFFVLIWLQEHAREQLGPFIAHLQDHLPLQFVAILFFFVIFFANISSDRTDDFANHLARLISILLVSAHALQLH